MKFARILIIAICVLSAAAVIGSFPAESWFASKAKLFQRVEPSAAAELFGDTGDMIGSPQRMIVEDTRAQLPGKGPSGSTLLNEKYLREHNIYPLQLKTVSYFGYWLRLASVVTFVISALLLYWLRRTRRAESSSA